MDKWLNDFKIALIEEDAQKLIKLHAVMPHFSEREELECAKALIEQAIQLLKKEKDCIKESLQTQKKVMKFQQNTVYGKERFNKSF